MSPHAAPRHPAPHPALREHRHPGVRPDGHAPGGARGTLCSGRKPGPPRRVALHRSARARGGDGRPAAGRDLPRASGWKQSRGPLTRGADAERPPPLGGRHVRAHVLHRQPAPTGDRDPVGPGSAAAPSAGGHLQTRAGPACGRGGRRHSGGAPSRLLPAGRTGGRLERSRRHPRLGGDYDGSWPARSGRTGPSRPQGRAHRSVTRRQAARTGSAPSANVLGSSPRSHAVHVWPSCGESLASAAFFPHAGSSSAHSVTGALGSAQK